MFLARTYLRGQGGRLRHRMERFNVLAEIRGEFDPADGALSRGGVRTPGRLTRRWGR